MFVVRADLAAAAATTNPTPATAATVAHPKTGTDRSALRLSAADRQTRLLGTACSPSQRQQWLVGSPPSSPQQT